jgi:hypothetical protein
MLLGLRSYLQAHSFQHISTALITDVTRILTVSDSLAVNKVRSRDPTGSSRLRLSSGLDAITLLPAAFSCPLLGWEVCVVEAIDWAFSIQTSQAFGIPP